MVRELRVEYPGAIYHVMNRGDRREAIVKDRADRLQFLATLREACQRSSWQAHAYCLMLIPSLRIRRRCSLVCKWFFHVSYSQSRLEFGPGE
jgi:hypothetical protein